MKTPTPEIRQAFYRRLLTALPLGPVTEADIAWPNSNFRPDPGRVYLAPAVLFAETEIASLSPTGFERLSGIFQISVYGIAGQGEGELDCLGQALTDLYRGGTLLPIPCRQHLSIARAWRSGLHFDDRPWLAVSASWHQYTQKGV